MADPKIKNDEVKITVVCPTCKTIKQIRKGTRVACDKCNRDMIEVKSDDTKKE